ncbi:MAG: spore cortex biosynthesis protein YabQ [Clostridia bacterium]|nr:spore cortex biosynthesis protein YabQ [Clostridia bacterium]
MGIFFDMFRTMRRLVKSGTVFVGVQDTVFWLFFAGAVFFFLYRFNYGQPRWFIFCGILLGALFYHLLLGDKIVRLFLLFFRFLQILLRLFCRILLIPFCILYRLLSPIFRFIKSCFCRIFRFFTRKIRQARYRFLMTAKKIKKRRKMY